MADYYNSSLKIDFTQTRDNHITQYYYFFFASSVGNNSKAH